MKKILNLLISPVITVVILLIAVIAMATATFIENDFGSEAAKKAVYNARWFEFLFLLFVVNLISNIVRFKLYKKQKVTLFIFHVALIIMIAGAAITRYFGFEGVMHIREDKSSSVIMTNNKVLKITASENDKSKNYKWTDDEVIYTKDFSDNIDLSDKIFNISIQYYYPKAVERAIPYKGGKSIVGFFLATDEYSGYVYISDGETKKTGALTIGYNNNKNADVYFFTENDTVFIGAKDSLEVSQMGEANNTKIKQAEVRLKTLYKTQQSNIVVREIFDEAVIAPYRISGKNPNAMPTYVFSISSDDTTRNFTVWESSGEFPKYTEFYIDNVKIIASFGSETVELPFSLYLKNFEIKRYPGSGSPSSYSSYIQIIRPGKATEKFHIYMNNILKADGYRFYQSSYDNDEKGTVLAVSYDALGTTITYVGYFLLFLGIVLSMINKNTFLHRTIVSKPVKISMIIVAFLLFGTNLLQAKDGIKHVSKEHADKFGRLLIQDSKGRTEPIYTFASDILRKLARKDNIYGMNPVQVFLEMNSNPNFWVNIPVVKISNRELQRTLGIKSDYASYMDFITATSQYKLHDLVNKAYNTPAGKQTKFDKAIIKADERVNICNSLFAGKFMNVFPVKGAENNKWLPAAQALKYAESDDDSVFLIKITAAYFIELQKSILSGNYEKPNVFVEQIHKYQQTHATYNLPSDKRVSFEILYYKINILKKLFPYYVISGVLFLFFLIGEIIKGKKLPDYLVSMFYGIIFSGFLAHIVGFAGRWYISGYAPMSNGYESLVFISLITILAGIIFSRQSQLALSATAILAGFTLMVANLSFMDPEITNLVPVLKSYWLTIHVSAITGSYGFLGLGAVLGIINLVLTTIQNKNNFNRIEETIISITKINHRTLILGLYFLTIGTFLGAIWANESWGRYWGWDPKETWSLITVLIYTIVTHARIIPGLKGVFTFNVLSVFAFFSVLMTYFGVNYYLSGLHSYAAGDPVPVPNFVYISVAAIVSLTFAASFRFYDNYKNVNSR
jgi:cytochrome c-type biogenesis protein CcsB